MLSPRLNFPSFFLFCIVLPALTTTSLHAARHASSLHPSAQARAAQLVRTELERSALDASLAFPAPFPLPRALRARVEAGPPLTLEASYLNPTFPTLPLAASGLWGERNSGGRVKVAGPHCPTPYGVRRSKLEKLGHSCLPFPGGSWWSFSGRGLGAETSSVPLFPLHAGDAK